jgi:hypothetical protein
MARTLKIKLSDPTLVSDVNQTLSSMFPLKSQPAPASYRGVIRNGAPVTIQQARNVATCAPLNDSNYGYTSGIFQPLPATGETVLQLIPATLILAPVNTSRITVTVEAGKTLVFTNFVLVSSLPNSLVPIAGVAITFNGGNTLSSGINLSDPINFTIDTQHDFWFMCWSTSAANPTDPQLVANVFDTDNGVMPNGHYAGTVSGGYDSTSSNPIVNTLYAAGSWIGSWVGQ